ncbi:PilW family protein [Deefgea tanakiae]|uniref:PilW family protein n=1 Tax=Deefgea tanakiae TaxID=2865840 RepID=A0ABX8Z4L3_9NEIS|nr:PilW family protein [Deefgea tanakiae]QZA77533.1 PilW family protein [Deefgea tanakiae]
MNKINQNENGFTIIELMIGLALAMVLTLAIANIYIQTRQTFRTQSAITNQADEGKFALSTIQRMIFQAGYINKTNMKTLPTTAFTANFGMNAGEIIKGNDQQINIRFMGDTDANIISCASDSSGNADYPSLKDSNIHGYRIHLDGTQLKCSKLSSAGAISDSQVIADNIVEFKVTYGIDSDTDKISDNYADSGITDWNKVYSIRTCIVTKSKENNIATKTNNRKYLNCTFPDHSKTSINSNEGSNYRTFSTTVYLRNKMN